MAVTERAPRTHTGDDHRMRRDVGTIGLLCTAIGSGRLFGAGKRAGTPDLPAVEGEDMTERANGVAVVTGGTAGIGRAAVREFARAGYEVAVLARGAAGLKGAVADVEAAGRRGVAVPTDVADAVAVEAAATRVESELGPIDVWANVAFVGVGRDRG